MRAEALAGDGLRAKHTHTEFHCFYHGLVFKPIELVEIEPGQNIFQHCVKGVSVLGLDSTN